MKEETEKTEQETDIEPITKPKKKEDKPIEEPAKKREFVSGFLQSLADFWGFK